MDKLPLAALAKVTRVPLVPEATMSPAAMVTPSLMGSEKVVPVIAPSSACRTVWRSVAPGDEFVIVVVSTPMRDAPAVATPLADKALAVASGDPPDPTAVR
jgi:hypothetical protein